jgi:hypothetical protein
MFGLLGTRKPWGAIVALLLCLMLPLTAHGQDQGTNAPLQGEFAVTIAAEDVPPDLIDGASLIGRWHITFSEGGAYVFGRQDVGPLVNGQFEIDGDRLTLHDESGVLACAAGLDDGAMALYTWRITGDHLQLVATEEPCARRRLLLTTRTLSLLVACPPQAQVLASATPAAGASPGATPLVSNAASTTPLIDDLLRQMSDCWATRDPDRFLPLLSRDFRATQQPADEDDMRRYTLAMGAPIVWERVSEVDLSDATHATASVRQVSGDTVDAVRYRFVFEDGAWRWDGIAVSA